MERFEEILELVENGENVMISSMGGTGKTFLLKELSKKLANSALMAPTGAAAVQLGGTTIHWFARLKVMNYEDFEEEEQYENLKEILYQHTKNNKDTKERIKNVNYIIIDEISMVGKRLFELLEYIIRKICKSDILFGGKTVILGGDFLQLPPVKDNWLFESEIWKNMNFTKIKLTECKRFENIEWFKMLSRIRAGLPTEKDIELLKERVEALKKLDIDNLQIKPMYLFGKNKDVKEHNENKLKNIQEIEQIYIGKDTINKNEINEKVAATLLEECIPKKIILKVGAQVVLKKNLSIEEKLINGTRGIIIEIIDNFPKILFENGITRIIKNERFDIVTPFYKITRIQIPLKLAWAVTIHSSQGGTINEAIINLDDIFLPGQAYVALSRVRSLEGVYLTNFNRACIKTDKRVLEFLKN